MTSAEQGGTSQYNIRDRFLWLASLASWNTSRYIGYDDFYANRFKIIYLTRIILIILLLLYERMLQYDKMTYKMTFLQFLSFCVVIVNRKKIMSFVK